MISRQPARTRARRTNQPCSACAVALHDRPVAVASLAKVMTAYLTLVRNPLSNARPGFTITVSAAQAPAVAQGRAEGQSVAVAVANGEQLTEPAADAAGGR